MSFITICDGNNRTYNYKEFVISDVSELSSLPTSLSEDDPCAKGSFCIVVSTGDIYVLNDNNIWSKVGL